MHTWFIPVSNSLTSILNSQLWLLQKLITQYFTDFTILLYLINLTINIKYVIIH